MEGCWGELLVNREGWYGISLEIERDKMKVRDTANEVSSKRLLGGVDCNCCYGLLLEVLLGCVDRGCC